MTKRPAPLMGRGNRYELLKDTKVAETSRYQRVIPITCFCRDSEEATRLATMFPRDSRALTTGAGTLAFHMLIAQHGAGEFQTLYVPMAMRDSFKTPAGGEVQFTEGAKA